MEEDGAVWSLKKSRAGMAGTRVMAGERRLPRLAARYVFSRGEGDAAYNLSLELEEGPDESLRKLLSTLR